MLSQDALKQAVAAYAVDYILPWLHADSVVGVGTGSTVDLFIDALAPHCGRFRAAVSSSARSTRRMQEHNFALVDLNEVQELAVYVDGADEINDDLVMIKGGGGALTQEKIVASLARRFVCIADGSKQVQRLGRFPLPVEVIPLAREAVARRLAQLGGTVHWRRDFVTDNGGHILDVAGLMVDTEQARSLESHINDIAGVISCGFFALSPADVALIADQDGVRELVRTQAAS